MIRRLACAFLLAASFMLPASAKAQGCAQCRDNAAGTPPATQRAYRRAIVLLTVSASGLFLFTVTLVRRQR